MNSVRLMVKCALPVKVARMSANAAADGRERVRGSGVAIGLFVPSLSD